LKMRCIKVAFGEEIFELKGSVLRLRKTGMGFVAHGVCNATVSCCWFTSPRPSQRRGWAVIIIIDALETGDIYIQELACWSLSNLDRGR